jgi:imidazolonepropionase-like amidohydrolase
MYGHAGAPLAGEGHSVGRTQGEQGMTAGRILIRGATLIDGSGRAPVKNGAVLTEGSRIRAVGEAAEVTKGLPAGDASLRVIEATGKTIMPGLIDSHCHINYGEPETEEELDLYTPMEYRALRAVWNAQKVLRAGVTSICDPGSTGLVAVAARDAIEAGMFEGPRVTAGGRYLSTHQSITDYYPNWIGVPSTSSGVLTMTKDEMVSEVRRQVKEGVDVVKIAGSGQSLYNVHAGSEVEAFTLDELRTIVDEVHRLGKKVTIHARSGKSAADAARAGVDWIQHASFMNEEDLEVVGKARTPICPTWTLLANIAEWGDRFRVPPALIDEFKRELEVAVKVMRRAIDVGIPLMMGSEAGFAVTPYGHWHARELELFVRYLGISPMEALMTATKNNTIALRTGGEVGLLAVGKLADVLVVDGDPLQDIRILQDRSRLSIIMQGGQIVPTDRPWPERKIWPYERTLTLGGLMTREAVERVRPAHTE